MGCEAAVLFGVDGQEFKLKCWSWYIIIYNRYIMIISLSLEGRCIGSHGQEVRQGKVGNKRQPFNQFRCRLYLWAGAQARKVRQEVRHS